MPNTPSFPPIGEPFNVLPTVDSTNNYAMALARRGLATHGSVYFAREQTMGRGQREKKWLSKNNQDIILSAVLQQTGFSLNSSFLLSASMALACFDFFKKYAGAEYTRIKWPNDIYWQDRKAGGILIETVGEQQRVKGEDFSNSEEMEASIPATTNSSKYYSNRWAIVGIGININQTIFEKDLLNPVSLKQITGTSWNIIELARELCRFMTKRFKSMHVSTPMEILEEYNAALYKLNQQVKLKKETAIFNTTITGVSIEGNLLTKDSLNKTFAFGEVEWVL